MIRMIAEQLQSQKTGAIVAAGTTSTGAASLLGWIPEEITKLSALVGVVLAIVMIIIHVTKEARERQESRLRVQQMELENNLLRKQVNHE